MIFWSIAIAITAVACAALFYAAAGRKVNAAGPDSADANSHFRLLLDGIDTDVANGKLGAEQALAARAELAREVLRSKKDSQRLGGDLGRGVLLGGLGVVAALSLGTYAILGSPEMPAQPLSDRPELAAQNLDLNEAIAQIETQLAQSPEDLRGWTVIAPAYVELGRYGDAADAYRQVIALSEPTAELRTNLAEALLLEAEGQGSSEALELLRAAVDSDPAHVRSRLYLSAELMRNERYDEAATLWNQAIKLAAGDEPWLPAARQGLAAAQNDGVDTTEQDQRSLIAGMVGGLADRLERDGGTVEEWTQLVRSYVVLGDLELAQAAYDASVAAYPAAFDRGELDTLALSAGLTLEGTSP